MVVFIETINIYLLIIIKSLKVDKCLCCDMDFRYVLTRHRVAFLLITMFIMFGLNWYGEEF